MAGEEIPIEKFDALLRSLVTWDLAVREEGNEAQNWHLVRRAQERLTALAHPHGPWPAERTAYVDHQCADCGRRKLTWLRDSTHVCDPCWEDRLASTQVESAITPSAITRRPRWVLWHRPRIA
jgi:hypothetical protein